MRTCIVTAHIPTELAEQIDQLGGPCSIGRVVGSLA
jgi:hypothetical protein